MADPLGMTLPAYMLLTLYNNYIGWYKEKRVPIDKMVLWIYCQRLCLYYNNIWPRGNDRKLHTNDYRGCSHKLTHSVQAILKLTYKSPTYNHTKSCPSPWGMGPPDPIQTPPWHTKRHLIPSVKHGSKMLACHRGTQVIDLSICQLPSAPPSA